MADAQLKLSRRALLGVACAAPVLSRHPELDSGSMNIAGAGSSLPCSWTPDQVRGDERRWNRTLAQFRRAESAVAVLEGHPDEAAFGRAHDRFNILFRRLLAHPAPDLAALATKLEIAVAAELADLTYAPPDLAAVARDARTLSSS